MIRIVIADDHELIREGLQKVFSREQDIELLGTACNAGETITLCRDAAIDVAVIDFNMPGRSGLDLVVHLKQIKPKMKVLVLSMMPEQEVAVRLLKAGADGFISKQSASEEVVDAVRKLASGRKYISERVAEQLADNIGADPTALPHEKLSDREFQVVQLIAEGRSTREIADELNLSSNTVATYRRRILEKLNLRTDVDVTRYAIKHQIVD